ncbi:MAG: hypothetical protein HC874_30435, partial [Richelia sp. SL_2_1]|nr:hypothetical protein [Richelia sp. SL_2_1]
MKKEIYKFAHLSDLHLGARPKGIRQRKLDIFNSFNWLVQKSLSMNCKINILCGDTFHTKIVDWETVSAYETYMSSSNIYTFNFVISGNHDDVKEWQWYTKYINMISPECKIYDLRCGASPSMYINVY